MYGNADIDSATRRVVAPPRALVERRYPGMRDIEGFDEREAIALGSPAILMEVCTMVCMSASKVRIAVLAACAALASPAAWPAEDGPARLPIQYEELTAPDFVRALRAAGNTVVIPMGILEKHGPHLPLGTDLLDAREVARRAAQREYVVVFPAYYFGQILEARHQPGTMAYSPKLMWDVLQETLDELGRNGFERIVLVSGHGGNDSFLRFFCQAQLDRRRPYVVYLFAPNPNPEADKRIQALHKSGLDMHAGEGETSTMLAHRPDLVQLERADDQSGYDQDRLAGLSDAYTAIWWYARFPNHYAGDGAKASRELGEAVIESEVEPLVRLLRAVKDDRRTMELQQRFFDQSEAPSHTPQ